MTLGRSGRNQQSSRVTLVFQADVGLASENGNIPVVLPSNHMARGRCNLVFMQRVSVLPELPVAISLLRGR